MREEEDKVFETRRQLIQRRRNPQPAPPKFIFKIIPKALLQNRRYIIVTAFSLAVGIFAFYYKTRTPISVDVIR